MDTILIQELAVPTHIGVTDEERATEQELKVSVWMETNVRSASQSDDIIDTIDYADVALNIQQLGKTERKTMERFTEDIASMILQNYKPISVKVLTKKYILPDADYIALSVTRP